MKRLITATAAAALAALMAFGALALAGPSELPPNWHVHDGQTAFGPQHKGIGFFPAILGLTTAEYLDDPAMCPDATDKVFLPNGKNPNQPLRSGYCQTSTTIIHLRSIRLDENPPDGWSLAPGTESVEGVTYVTYFKLN